jgi:ribonucleoside-diphosphate reductase alpha chain
MELARNEAMIFKGGSGSGTNFSNLRAKDELLSKGGKASGPVSFMKGFDAFSGVIKSGGRTRRAAKLALLDVEHPDIMEFIESKRLEELKAQALIAAGYSPDFEQESGAYTTVAFQNENHSVRLSDEFMRAVKESGDWNLYGVCNGELMRTYSARDIFLKICECAHACGDPGVQFSDTINRYNTTPESGEIRTSNPCGEIMDIDDSACNLGSHNLMRYVSRVGAAFSFDVDSFVKAIDIATLAQEILVGSTSYPTEQITNNTIRHRQLGQGFSNLGTLVMYCGFPYDSENARSLAAGISSLLTASVYRMSTIIAAAIGSFDAFEANKDAMWNVLCLHQESIRKINRRVPEDVLEIIEAADSMWSETLDSFEENGCRNSKATALAPTGTTSFMMDCDTTGVEPETSLVKQKTLVGGGSISIVNKTIGHALKNLGYKDVDAKKIFEHIVNEHDIAKCGLLKKEHIPVFDCAIGQHAIKLDGHVKMIAAIQPHISGGISKTVNMPSNATVEDVYKALLLAYDLGAKAITVYRDGSKDTQPLNVRKENAKEAQKLVRRRLPSERDSVTHKFKIGGTYKGYLTVGFFPDSKPGELFIESSKAGSTMNGLLNCFAQAVSIALQYGVPLEKFISQFAYVSFEPSGFSSNTDIGYVRSIVDYVFRYMEKFVVKNGDEEDNVQELAGIMDSPPCPRCGNMMKRSGTCFTCSCGETSGCG